MASRTMTADVNQGELGLRRRAEPNTMPRELILRQKSAAAAFALACQSSGLEDKEIFGELEIDAGYFSRIKAGTATLQADKQALFCRVVNNTIYPEWLAYQLGCTLTMLKSEAERQADELRAQLADKTRENLLMKQLLTGKVPA